MLEQLYFLVFAVIGTFCALGLLIVRHPITGAVNLVGVMLSLAGIYGVLSGPFLGIVQILVYAGAIMMLVVFVIMVLNGARDRRVPSFEPARVLVLALPAAFAYAVITIVLAAELPTMFAAEGTVENLSGALFDFSHESRGYYVLFEVIGLVLLAALTGAVLLAKRRLDSPADRAEDEG